MRFLWIIFFLSVTAALAEGKRKKGFEGDFEFADEVQESKPNQKPGAKRWIHDPNSELCKPLNCKKKEMCLIDENYAAVCVSKKEIHRNGDIIVPKLKATEPPAKDKEALVKGNEEEEDDDDIFYDSEDGQDDEDSADSLLRCKTCPIVKPVFFCGSDNRTYSSLCRLDYHNCLHKSHVKVSCKGFCPCKESDSLLKKKQKQAERMNNLMAKFRSTMEKERAKYKSEKQPEKKPDGEKPHKAPKFDRYGPKAAPEKKAYHDKYSYVPEDFKYDNKHYKYIKYKKYSKDIYGTNSPYGEEKSHNEVIETKPSRPAKDCSPNALQSMGNRLLDWFSVVMSESKRRKQHKVKGDLPGWCKSEVRWMFGYLDLDGDEKLSLQELYHMEDDHAEKCAKPFVDSCDTDRDIFISPKEWCHCFDKTDRPCAAVRRRLTPDLLGAFVPDCDSQGYFHPTQCHAAVGMCWCVDKHGVEFANSRTRGKPNCEALAEKSRTRDSEKKEAEGEKINVDDDDENDEDEDDDDDDDDDDDEDDGHDADFEGSADQPLDF